MITPNQTALFFCTPAHPIWHPDCPATSSIPPRPLTRDRGQRAVLNQHGRAHYQAVPSRPSPGCSVESAVVLLVLRSLPPLRRRSSLSTWLLAACTCPPGSIPISPCAHIGRAMTPQRPFTLTGTAYVPAKCDAIGNSVGKLRNLARCT